MGIQISKPKVCANTPVPEVPSWWLTDLIRSPNLLQKGLSQMYDHAKQVDMEVDSETESDDGSVWVEDNPAVGEEDDDEDLTVPLTAPLDTRPGRVRLASQARLPLPNPKRRKKKK